MTEDAAAAHEHTEREDDFWEISIPDHPERTESDTFRRAKETAHKIVRATADPLVKSLQETP